MDDLEWRLIRDRIEEIDQASDRLFGDRPARQVPVLGQVYNAGSMPTAANKFFAVHPVDPDGTETEGSTASLNANTSAQLNVIVLGSPPNVGDNLVCFPVGDRWVARKKGSTSAACGGCDLPDTLTLNFRYQSGPGSTFTWVTVPMTKGTIAAPPGGQPWAYDSGCFFVPAYGGSFYKRVVWWCLPHTSCSTTIHGFAADGGGTLSTSTGCTASLQLCVTGSALGAALDAPFHGGTCSSKQIDIFNPNPCTPSLFEYITWV